MSYSYFFSRGEFPSIIILGSTPSMHRTGPLGWFSEGFVAGGIVTGGIGLSAGGIGRLGASVIEKFLYISYKFQGNNAIAKNKVEVINIIDSKRSLFPVVVP